MDEIIAVFQELQQNSDTKMKAQSQADLQVQWDMARTVWEQADCFRVTSSHTV